MRNKKKMRTKKKVHQKRDGSWDTSDLYRNTDKYPFNIEWMKYYNPIEGRDQIIFLYIDKETNRVIKHRVMR